MSKSAKQGRVVSAKVATGQRGAVIKAATGKVTAKKALSNRELTR